MFVTKSLFELLKNIHGIKGAIIATIYMDDLKTESGEPAYNKIDFTVNPSKLIEDDKKKGGKKDAAPVLALVN